MGQRDDRQAVPGLLARARAAGFVEVDERVTGGCLLAVRLVVTEPVVQSKVACAVLAGEQMQLGHRGGQPLLDSSEQGGTELLALPVGNDGEATDLRNARCGGSDPQAHRGDETAAGVTPADGDHLAIGELGGDIVERLQQRRKVQVSVRLRRGSGT
jgi:hypothetical protein